MDQNQGTQVTLTDNELEKLADVKAQLVKDIKGELAALGYEPVPQSYDGGADIAALVDKAHKIKMTYKEEVTRIKERYAPKVAEEKLKVLEVDHKLDMQSLASDIDDIVEKDHQYREMAMKELVSDPQYKEAKMECFNIMNILQNVEANYEIVADIIDPLIRAKDVKSLEIVKLLTKDTTAKFFIDKTITNINNYKANVELTNFANSAKSFFLTGQNEFTLFNYMSAYKKEK